MKPNKYSIALGDAIWKHQSKISCAVGFVAGVALMKYTRVNVRTLMAALEDTQGERDDFLKIAGATIAFIESRDLKDDALAFIDKLPENFPEHYVQK